MCAVYPTHSRGLTFQPHSECTPYLQRTAEGRLHCGGVLCQVVPGPKVIRRGDKRDLSSIVLSRTSVGGGNFESICQTLVTSDPHKDAGESGGGGGARGARESEGAGGGEGPINPFIGMVVIQWFAVRFVHASHDAIDYDYAAPEVRGRPRAGVLATASGSVSPQTGTHARRGRRAVVDRAAPPLGAYRFFIYNNPTVRPRDFFDM